MKPKLLYLIGLLCCSLNSFSQVTIGVPSIHKCDENGNQTALFNMYFDASVLIEAGQPANQNGYSISMHTSLAGAILGQNPIINYDAYTNISNPQQIFYRVVNNDNNNYATGNFFLEVATELYDVPDQTVCGSFTLPFMNLGHFYTQSNGQGQLLQPGTMLTESQTVYLYEPACSLPETHFTLTVIPFPPAPQPVYSCGPYTLPPLAMGNYYTAPGGPNGQGTVVVPGTVISANTALYVYVVSDAVPICVADEMLEIFTGLSVAEALFANCDPDQDGIGSFDLYSGLFNIADNSVISFHLTAEAAQNNTAPQPEIFANTVPFEQTIYVRHSYDGVDCFQIYPLLLKVPVMEYNIPSPIAACDTNGDNTYTIESFFDATLQITYGTSSEVWFFPTLAAAENDQSTPLEAPYVGSQTVLYALISSFGCTVIVPVPVAPVNCTPDINVVTGTITFDANADGCTAGNPDNFSASGLQVSYTGTDGTYVTTTNADGFYVFYDVPDGVGSVSVVNLPTPLTTATPTTAVIFQAGVNEAVADFCLTATSSLNDVSVLITPITDARPGFVSFYKILVVNKGTTVASGTVNLSFDTTKVDFEYATAGAATGNTYSFNYTVSPFTATEAFVHFYIAQPPTVVSGTVLTYTATVVANGTDAVPVDNVYVLDQIAVNAYDPNDITVHEGAYIWEDETSNYLHYTIRFQNTGTTYATHVRLETELDNNLDWSTFEPLDSSHLNHMLRNGNAVSIYFDDIYLPDSTVDEYGSNGYLTYRIKPKNTVTLGDVMTATAGIYFDFNPAIVTNTATTMVASPLGVEGSKTLEFIVYPNPASRAITVQLATAADVSVTICDISGKIILHRPITEVQSNLDLAGLQSGLYLISLTDDHGNVSTKKLLVQ